MEFCHLVNVYIKTSLPKTVRKNHVMSVKAKFLLDRSLRRFFGLFPALGERPDGACTDLAAPARGLAESRVAGGECLGIAERISRNARECVIRAS